MVLQPWVSSVYWVQEACTLIVYPSTDDELLAYKSPHCLVSVKQGTNAHQCFVYYTEPQDGEPLQSLSKFVRYLQSFRDCHSDRQNLAGQFSSAILRPLQLGLIRQRRRRCWSCSKMYSETQRFFEPLISTGRFTWHLSWPGYFAT